MKLFLSYPSPQRALAERLALALEAEGHEVFIDRTDLKAGEAFHQALREAILAADAMVFLVTPRAVAPGSYALAELEIARSRWRHPAGRVLPVLVEPTPVGSIPAYLTAVTLLQPRGELVAETVAAVARLVQVGGGAAGGRVKAVVVAALALAVAGGGWALWRQNQATQQATQAQAVEAARQAEQASARSRQAEQAAQAGKVVLAQAAVASQRCADGNHASALSQLGALAEAAPAAVPGAPALSSASVVTLSAGGQAPALASGSPGLAAALQTAREDCAMQWLRHMRAVQGQSSFAQQVALTEPVLVHGLAGAQGPHAANLRAHLGWGDYLRRREGAEAGDPVAQWQRALADDPGNVFAHAMWARQLLDPPARLAEARQHFAQAEAAKRERAYVRRLQFGGTLGGGAEATAYALTVADTMRRSNETLPEADRWRLWSAAFSTRLLDPAQRAAYAAALPPADLLATFEGLYPAEALRADQQQLRRYNLAVLQAAAGQSDAARAGLQALVTELRAARSSGSLLDGAQRALAGLGGR